MNVPDISKVTEVNKFRNQLVEDIDNFEEFFSNAKSEIEYYDWCLEILESYVGMFFAGIVGVFLFKIKPSSPNVDNWLWVVVGDLPPIYITCENSPNAANALDAYIGAMEEWVQAASQGDSVEGLIPVNVPANKENAEALGTRLKLLDEMILSQYKGDLVN